MTIVDFDAGSQAGQVKVPGPTIAGGDGSRQSREEDPAYARYLGKFADTAHELFDPVG